MSDHDRPLNTRGKRDAPRVGHALLQRGLQPDLVLSSTAKRARKTARKVVDASGFDVELRWVEEFYLAPPNAYVKKLQTLSDEINQVLVVGHNPGLQDLLESLSGRHEHMATAALAQLELPVGSWSELQLHVPCRLAWFWSPKDDA